MAPHRRAVEHGAAGPHGDRRDPAGDLGEERAEPEQVRLPAGGALRADGEVAAREHGLHDQTVPGSVARQPDGRDRRDQLREAGEAVRRGGHLPAHHLREDHRVHQRLVVAGVQCASAVRRRAGGLRCVELSSYLEAGGGGEEEADAVREDADEDTCHSEEDAEWEPEDDDEADERVGPDDEATVMEDQRPGVLPPRQGRRRFFLRLGHHTALLANLQERRLPVSGGARAQADIDDAIAPKNGHQSSQAPVARRGDRAGESPPGHPQLRPDDADLACDVLPDERLHHDCRQARHDVLLALVAREGPERAVPEVLQEEPGQCGPRHRRHVADTEPGGGNEGHDEERKVIVGESNAEEGDERVDGEQDGGPERAAGLEGDEEEAGEEAAGDEERALQLGGDTGAPARSHGVAASVSVTQRSARLLAKA